MNTLKYSYFNRFYGMDEMQKFVDVIHHTHDRAHSGRIVALIKEDNPPTQKSFTNINKLCNFLRCEDNGKNNVYVSLNETRGYRRDTSGLHALNGFYVDIDVLHGEKSTKSITEVKSALDSAWNSGKLPIPTMITHSGRGFGIYYILNRSIANTKGTLKQRKLFAHIYEALFDAYEAILGKEVIDRSVRDVSRVVRVPGTVNPNCNERCHLYENEIRYCDMSELKEMLNTYKANSYKAEIIDFSAAKAAQMLQYRLGVLSSIQKLKAENGLTEGFRDELCWQFYNASVCTVGRDIAKKNVLVFNQGFTNPLSEREVLSITKGIDSHKGEGDFEGINGYYKVSDKTIAERLGLTADEAKMVGLGCSRRTMQRKEAKLKTAYKKTERDNIIRQIRCEKDKIKLSDFLILVNDALTMKNIPSISNRTLRNILKRLKLEKSTNMPWEETAAFKKIHKKVQNQTVEKMPLLKSGKKMAVNSGVKCNSILPVKKVGSSCCDKNISYHSMSLEQKHWFWIANAVAKLDDWVASLGYSRGYNRYIEYRGYDSFIRDMAFANKRKKTEREHIKAFFAMLELADDCSMDIDEAIIANAKRTVWGVSDISEIKIEQRKPMTAKQKQNCQLYEAYCKKRKYLHSCYGTNKLKEQYNRLVWHYYGFSQNKKYEYGEKATVIAGKTYDYRYLASKILYRVSVADIQAIEGKDMSDDELMLHWISVIEGRYPDIMVG